MSVRGEITRAQNHALLYVARYETPEYGVVIAYHRAAALVRKGYAVDAARRRSARTTGACVRLTEEGRKWLSR